MGGIIADVFKDEELQLHFTTNKENELSDEVIFKLIDLVGYEPKNFKIERVDFNKP